VKGPSFLCSDFPSSPDGFFSGALFSHHEKTFLSMAMALICVLIAGPFLPLPTTFNNHVSSSLSSFSSSLPFPWAVVVLVLGQSNKRLFSSISLRGLRMMKKVLDPTPPTSDFFFPATDGRSNARPYSPFLRLSVLALRDLASA